MESRRSFIKKVATALGMVAIDQEVFSKPVHAKPKTVEAWSTVYRALNGRPDENLSKVIDLMGGIEKIVGPDDAVVIKPNLQWWNQGAPNLLTLKTFVDLVMARPGGFHGEVVLAENCHRGAQPWASTAAGWSRNFEWNADVPGVSNCNDLCTKVKASYGERFSVRHWIDVDSGGKRVYGPQEGQGYVYCDGTGGVPLISFDNGARAKDSRATIMTYPILKTDKGTIVDLKEGIWEKGAYTGRPLKLINFAALNHHSTFCGVTSSIKNYLGVVDLSGGSDPQKGGRVTGQHFNFHSFAFNWSEPGPVPGMIGAEVGHFMKTIRRADLNVVTAEWVGLSSRIDPPVARTRAVLASTDPVALDYHSAKYVLYPHSRLTIHNPEDRRSPLHQYLVTCADQGGGVIDEKHVKVESYDFGAKRIQRDEDLIVHAEKQWGTNPKAILKYLYLRYGLTG